MENTIAYPDFAIAGRIDPASSPGPRSSEKPSGSPRQASEKVKPAAPPGELQPHADAGTKKFNLTRTGRLIFEKYDRGGKLILRVPAERHVQS